MSLKKIIKKIPFSIQVYRFFKSGVSGRKTSAIGAYSEPYVRNTQQMLKAAVIGAGNMGIATYNALASLNNVEIIGVADISQQSLKNFREKTGCPDSILFRDADTMLEKNQPDLLCISTTAPSHMMLAKKAIMKKIPKLLIEKPMSTNIADAKEVLRMAQENGTVIAVNHSRRWSQNYTGVKSMLKSGRYGHLRSAYLAFGKGGIGMLGIHYIDLLRYLFDSEIKAVSADFDKEEEVNSRGADFKDPSGRVLLKFADGGRAYMDFSSDLIKRDKFLVLKTDSARLEIDESNEQIRVIDGSGIKNIGFVHPDFTGAKRIKPVLASLLSGDVPNSDGTDGLKAIEALVAVNISAESGGREISLPLDPESEKIVLRIP